MTDLAPSSVLLVVLLGGLGAAARLLVDWLVSRRSRRELPVATLLINVTGSFLIGVLSATVATGHPDAFALAATGFCGGYTTFSTAMVESVRLAREGAWRTAAWSAAGTLVLCVAAAAAGVLLGHALT
jgi:CrcB protein